MPNKGKLLDRKVDTTYNNNSTSHYIRGIYTAHTENIRQFYSKCQCGWSSFMHEDEYQVLDALQQHIETLWHSRKANLNAPYLTADGFYSITCTCGWYNVKFLTHDDALRAWEHHRSPSFVGA